MANVERIVSPGVFTREFDYSFLPQGIGDIGAAIIGPTPKGPAFIPTVINSREQFERIFGVPDSTFFVPYTAVEYMREATTATIVRILPTGSTNAETALIPSGSGASGSVDSNFNPAALFKFVAINTGFNGNTNASGSSHYNGLKVSIENAVLGVNGRFSVAIRQGDDTNTKKFILETYSGVNLEQDSINYIGRRIGDVKYEVTADNKVEATGVWKNRSSYLRVEVSESFRNFSKYTNDSFTLLPSESIYEFTGGTDGVGYITGSDARFGDRLTLSNNQGLSSAAVNSAYVRALITLSNDEEYDINLISMPGIWYSGYPIPWNRAKDVCESRTDCFFIGDLVLYDGSITDATGEAEFIDSNYVGAYYPWLRIVDPVTGALFTVPPSAVLPAIYAKNDRLAAPWFAPAGLNRGTIPSAVTTVNRLTRSERDDLYENKVNPIAQFPGQGVVVWGQKTLQARPSALDRINVRRLLIALRKYIASITRYLVFENNTAQTRNRFINIATPYLESVVQRQGLYSFKIVMDGSNNTADVIDRNEMRGAIYLKPAKAAEFIILDFNILPTGASFPEDASQGAQIGTPGSVNIGF